MPYCIMHLEEQAKEEQCEDLTVESTLNAATFIRVTALSHAVRRTYCMLNTYGYPNED